MTSKQCINYPTTIKKSTSTATSYINISIDGKEIDSCSPESGKEYYFDIPLLSRCLPLGDDVDFACKNGGIAGINSSTDCLRGDGKPVKFLKKRRNRKARTSDERRKISSRYRFDNQVSMDFRYWEFRNVNVKIFNNGKLQMTGMQYETEIKLCSNSIIRILKDSKLRIYTDTSQFPKTDHDMTYITSYNKNTDTIGYYRWNYFKTFGNIAEFCGYSKIGSNEIGWNSDEDINKFITYLTDKKTAMENQRAIYSGNDKFAADINKLEDDIYDLEKIIKYVETVRSTDNAVAERLLEKYRKLLKVSARDGDIMEDDIINKKYQYNSPKPEKMAIEMINSDFNIAIPLNNSALYKLLGKYQYKRSYQPSDYPGISLEYYWNKDCPLMDGKCHCKSHCAIVGKAGKCDLTTILIFQSGNIVITRARTSQQIKDSYNFIRNFIHKHKKTILGKYSDEDIKKIENRTNEQRKLLKKHKLYYFDKTSIEMPAELNNSRKALLSQHLLSAI